MRTIRDQFEYSLTRHVWEQARREKAIQIAKEVLGLETWWRNHYYCVRCDREWTDDWASQSDDACPRCGTMWCPERSDELNGEGGEPLP